MGRLRGFRAAFQAGSVGFCVLLALNAAYLVRRADQFQDPGPFLSLLARWGLFPFGPDSGILSIEDYCPLGPVEGVVRFAKTAILGEGLSFVGPVTLRNLGVLLAVLGLVLLTKKTFCSWLCPFGALFEGLGTLGRRLWLPRWRPKVRLDRDLRRLRFASLALLVALTAGSGTLIFKEVDPFLALYSLGSDVRPTLAYAFLLALLAASLFLPGVWCHYLCPLGGFLDPFSKLGRIRPTRIGDVCTSCGVCARSCPQRIPIPARHQVTDAQCTNCLDCLDACPEGGALELRLYLK